MDTALPVVAEQMVKKFQCPGCVAGSDLNCGHFKLHGNGQDGHTCSGWHPGTTMMGHGAIALGLPKGFNHLGTLYFLKHAAGNSPTQIIRLFEREEYQTMLDTETPTEVEYAKINVPVWAMVGQGEEEGYLFVRTFAPRIGWHWIDVVKDGTLDMVPTALNVGEFYDEID